MREFESLVAQRSSLASRLTGVTAAQLNYIGADGCSVSEYVSMICKTRQDIRDSIEPSCDSQNFRFEVLRDGRLLPVST